MRKNIFAAIALVISIGVCLLVSEAALRIKNMSMENYDIEMWRYAKELKQPSTDPALGHEHIPSSTATLQSTDFRINSRGLRGGPIEAAAPARRILFLGSSITLGWGVPEADTLTARLQRMLSAEGHDVEVLNAGIGNYNAARYVRNFMTRLTDLEPTDIVVHYFVNDAEALESGGGNFLLRNSQVAVTLWVLANRMLHSGGEGGLEAHYRKVYDPQAPGYVAMKKSLEALSDYCKEKGIRLYLAMTPDVHNLEDYPFTFIHDEMREIAMAYGYEYVDLYPALSGVTPEEIWAMPGDPHPNARGHEKMAQALYTALSENR